MVRVKDLKNQTGINRNNVVINNPVLYCVQCGEAYSANAGDYWAMDPETIFKHCKYNMVLATRRETYEIIKP